MAAVPMLAERETGQAAVRHPPAVCKNFATVFGFVGFAALPFSVIWRGHLAIVSLSAWGQRFSVPNRRNILHVYHFIPLV